MSFSGTGPFSLQKEKQRYGELQVGEKYTYELKNERWTRSPAAPSSFA